jgi:hypothetical protein
MSSLDSIALGSGRLTRHGLLLPADVTEGVDELEKQLRQCTTHPACYTNSGPRSGKSLTDVTDGKN